MRSTNVVRFAALWAFMIAGGRAVAAGESIPRPGEERDGETPLVEPPQLPSTPETPQKPDFGATGERGDSQKGNCVKDSKPVVTAFNEEACLKLGGTWSTERFEEMTKPTAPETKPTAP